MTWSTKSRSRLIVRRSAISSLVWVSCAPVLFFYGVLVLAEFEGIARGAPVNPDSLIHTSIVSGALGWIALFVMNVFWLMNRQLGLAIPTFGTLFALIGWLPFLLTFSAIALWPLPGVVFASYLVHWHVKGKHALHGYGSNPNAA